MSQISKELLVLDQKAFAYDFEANGLKYMDKGFFVRCVSFHNDEISFSVEISDSKGNYYSGASALFAWLANQPGLIAHNASYEMGVLFAMTGKMVDHKACTYMLLARLANEGSPGQSWGLKVCARELLGWDDWSKDIPKSAEMAYIPFDKLGNYNQIDSAATWEIYKLCMQAVTNHKDTWGPYFLSFLATDMREHIRLQLEAYTQGLRINEEYTKENNTQVLLKVAEYEQNFLTQVNVKPFIDAYNEAIAEKAQEEVVNYKQKFKNNGEPTINYQKKLAWYEALKQENHFNMNSPLQLSHLLYVYLKSEARLLTEGGNPSTAKKALEEIPIYGKLILDYREMVSQYKFLRACLENTQDGLLRINVKVPGTLTGRCSSGSPD